MLDEICSEGSYAERQKAIKSALASAAKKSGSKVLGQIVKEQKNRDDKEVSKRCEMSRMVFNESMDMYREGEMTFSEAVEDLYKALKQI